MQSTYEESRLLWTSRVEAFKASGLTHYNDIDILIEDNIDYRMLSSFRDELQKLTDKRIDIVMGKYAHPIVLHRAMKEIIYVTKH